MKKKIVSILCVLLLLTTTVMLAACSGSSGKDEEKETEAVTEEAEENAEAEETEDNTEAEETTETAEAEGTETAAETASGRPTQDREGNDIVIPEEVNKIVSLAPATMQILESVGVKDKVVGIDTQTPMYVEGVDDLPQFDMMEPDVEAIAALEPDIVFTTGMSYIEGDPYSALIDLGICVIVIPSSTSINGVEEDIQFTADCVGKSEEAKAIVSDMEAKIAEVKAIGDTITEKKTVMFEISALPYIYSFGKNTFLDEMITIIGAENVFADQDGWIPVAEEDAVAANPDVILTSVNYIDDSVGEILAREGWENVTAVANKDVYYIDNAKSSLPNQYIVDALWEMAEAVYPEAFAELENAA